MTDPAPSPAPPVPAPPAPAPLHLAVGRLLRLSLLPSALADVLAGLALGTGGGWPPGRALLLVLASLGVYHGAMALNDWVDRAHDARTRPERPIPSGRVPAGAALGLALVLQLGGVAAGFAVHPRAGLWVLGLAVLSAGYDVVGRGAWRGPLLLALCRAGNLGLGVLAPAWLAGAGAAAPGEAAPWVPEPWVLTPAVGYGVYVFLLSRLGRLEDGEGGELGDRPRLLLRACAAALVAVGVLAGLGGRAVLGVEAGWLGPALALVPVVPGAFGLWRASERSEPWTPAAVGGAMGLCLRRLLLCSAACAAAVLPAGPYAPVALVAALGGYPLALALRRVFPPS